MKTIPECEWLEERRRYIGSSESRILYDQGYSDETRLTLYAAKVSGAQALETAPMTIGRELEPALIQMACRRLDAEQQILPDEFRWWASVGHMSCTPDARICLPDGEIVSLETKAVGWHDANQWTSESPSLRALIQVQHQLYVAREEYQYLAALINSTTFRLYCIHADRKFQEDLAGRCETFMQDFVLPGIRPRPTGRDSDRRALQLLLPEDNGETLEISEDYADHCSQLMEARLAQKQAESQRSELENWLRDIIGDHSRAIMPDGTVVSWTKTKTGRRLSFKEQNALELHSEP